MSNVTKPTEFLRVGIVGAGQLARMMGEVSNDVNVEVTVLGENGEDSAVATCAHFAFGEATDVEALRRLANSVDVITFDHELVDLDVLTTLQLEGIIVRPSPESLLFAVDKGYQRHRFREANLPVPRFLVVSSAEDTRLSAFLDELELLPVVKSARGGYDGRGVQFPTSLGAVLQCIRSMATTGDVVVEERLVLKREVAQLVARDVEGDLTFYPVVDTVQSDGMCVEVRFPSDLSDDMKAEAQHLSQEIATLVQGVGVMAIEYFVTNRGLVINEVALRPHNAGHWTIEGTRTSQFAQHLLAVSGQKLGSVEALSDYVAMVNVVGGKTPGSLDAAREVDGTFVHDYGKSWRPGRKLGHVTALGDDATGPHVRAWTSARAYGTASKEA